MKNFINKFRYYLILFLPAVLFFSYYPLIPLGEANFMHLELSLPLVWLALLALASIPDFLLFIKNFKSHTKPYKILFSLASVFIIYCTSSIIWSENPIRTLLTAGILWCIFISVTAFSYFRFTKNFRNKFIKYFLISTIVVCAFCWIQCILDILNISRDISLLCTGCTSTSFGFPHPNGFAIEPQFMGNLLLIPSFLSLYLLATSTATTKREYLFISLFIISTLFLTFSRGAIYAFCIGFLFWIIFNSFKQHSSAPLKNIIIVFTAFVIALFTQGIFSTASFTNDTFVSGVTKSIHHLSLGIIDLRPAPQPSAGTTIGTSFPSADFDGYVEESTNIRLDLSRIAWEVSTSNPQVFLFGVGLGGTGAALSATEIIQNEYMSLLLELGLVGIILATSIIVLLFIIIIKKQAPSMMLAVIIAFLLTLGFFSGLPNALHIYLLPPLLLFIL